MEKLTLAKFDIPPDFIRPDISADEYVRWMEENWRLLRQEGKLDELCDALGRCPVNTRLTLNEHTD